MSSTAVQAFIAEGIAPVSFPGNTTGLYPAQQIWQVPSTYAALIETVYIEADFGGQASDGQTFVLSFQAQDGKTIWAYPAPQYSGNGSPTPAIYTWFRGGQDSVQFPGWQPGVDDTDFEPGVAGPPLPNFYMPPLSTINVAQYSVGTELAATLSNMAVVYTPLEAGGEAAAPLDLTPYLLPTSPTG